MYKHFWSFLVVALVLSSGFDRAECSSLSGVSWIFQGTAQQNNTALTFNLYDTLNLQCRASVDGLYGAIVFIISKGSSAPTDGTYAKGVLTLSNVGTLIYSDVDGLKSGYENFAVHASPYCTVTQSTMLYEFRYVNVDALKTTDAATYHCSAADISTPSFFTSGGLTIVVNTKSGQAHSSRARANSMLAYSAVMLGASKLFF